MGTLTRVDAHNQAMIDAARQTARVICQLADAGYRVIDGAQHQGRPVVQIEPPRGDETLHIGRVFKGGELMILRNGARTYRCTFEGVRIEWERRA